MRRAQVGLKFRFQLGKLNARVFYLAFKIAKQGMSKDLIFFFALIFSVLELTTEMLEIKECQLSMNNRIKRL